MAGMGLQCVKDSGSHVHNAAELNTALNNIKQKLLASRRTDGHYGNEFSTGLVVQVRIFSRITYSAHFVSFTASNPAERTLCTLNLLIQCDPGLVGNGHPGCRVCIRNGGHEDRRQKQHLPQPHGLISDPASSPAEILPDSKKQGVSQRGWYVQHCFHPLWSLLCSIIVL